MNESRKNDIKIKLNKQTFLFSFFLTEKRDFENETYERESVCYAKASKYARLSNHQRTLETSWLFCKETHWEFNSNNKAVLGSQTSIWSMQMVNKWQ